MLEALKQASGLITGLFVVGSLGSVGGALLWIGHTSDPGLAKSVLTAIGAVVCVAGLGAAAWTRKVAAS